MATRTNLAYKELVIPKPEQSYNIKRAPKSEKVISPAVVIFAIITVAVLLGYMVFNVVELNQVNNEINTANSQIKILNSEKVRLSSELESKMSLTNIEKYAKEKLGLSKLSSGQVTYLNTSGGNSIEIPQDKNRNVFETVWASIKDFFSYLIK